MIVSINSRGMNAYIKSVCVHTLTTWLITFDALLWCTVLMHFGCTLDALSKSASKVHPKCIQSASKVHPKCIIIFLRQHDFSLTQVFFLFRSSVFLLKMTHSSEKFYSFFCLLLCCWSSCISFELSRSAQWSQSMIITYNIFFCKNTDLHLQVNVEEVGSIQFRKAIIKSQSRKLLSNSVDQTCTTSIFAQ